MNVAEHTEPTAPAGYDQARAEAFAEEMLGLLNHGAMALMTSIGHRTGLFDTLADLPASDSGAIAAAAGLNERYVREWLGAMVAGGFVDYDPAADTYLLPPEHAESLTRRSPSDNLAVFTQHITQLAHVEDDIVECFRHGGGVPYSRYRRFHEIMAEDSGQSVLPVLRSHVLPLVQGLEQRLAEGIRVLDAGCGRGKALNQLAQWFPASRFTGYDLSEEAIAHAREEARRLGNDNVAFEVRDLSDFDDTAEPGCYDFVTTFDAVHDQARPMRLLSGIRRSLAPGGVYLCQDISGSVHVHENAGHPLGPMLYTVSCLHCMTVSLAQGGDGLGAMWGHQTTLEYLRNAGFSDVSLNTFEHDIQNYWYVCRP